MKEDVGASHMLSECFLRRMGFGDLSGRNTVLAVPAAPVMSWLGHAYLSHALDTSEV